MIKGVLYLLIVAIEQLKSVDIEYGTYLGHCLSIHLGPFVSIGKQGDTAGMVNQSHYTLGLEIGQDGYDYGLICVYGQIGETPAGAVLGAQGYTFAFLDAGIFEYDVEACY